MSVKIEEEVELIAVRVPPGDNWELLIDKDNVVEGLVQALTQYMRKTKFKGNYRLEPLNNKLYAVKMVEVDLEEPEEMIWDLYGEGEFK